MRKTYFTCASTLLQFYEQETINSADLTRNQEKTYGIYKARIEGILTEYYANCDNENGKLLRSRFEAIGAQIVPNLAKADLLAGKYQQRYRFASKAIYTLAALAVIIVAAQFLFHLNHLLVGLEILFMIAVLLIIRHGNQMGWHRRWLEYRLLAEQLRFELLASFLSDDKTRDDIVHFPRESIQSPWRTSILNGIKQGINPTAQLTPANLECLKLFLKKAWIADQRDYHKQKSIKDHRMHKSISTCGEIFYGLTLLVAVLHFFHFGNDVANRLWTFLAISFPVIGSAFSALRAHFEYQKNAERSGRMAEGLQDIYEQVDAINDLQALSELLKKIEILMLQENVDWHCTMRIHHLEKPA